MAELNIPPVGSFDGRKAGEEEIPQIKKYSVFDGDIVVGTRDPIRALAVALCIIDHPVANQFLLDSKMTIRDNLTKTKIFPREGMALPDGKTYSQKS